MIRNLPARYPELGRIRFGHKETVTGRNGKEIERPVKGKTLIFTSNDDVMLKALASQHGGELEEWEGGEQTYRLLSETDSVPVFLPADPIDTWYERWGAGGIARRCDGERCTVPVQDPEGGHMEEHDCMCLREDLTPGDTRGGACAVTVRLRVVIPDVPGIGIWLATSHSVYAALELPGQVALLEQMRAKGQLVPAVLAIDARTEKKPWEKFKRDFIVPVLRVRASLSQLAAGGGMIAAGELAPPMAAIGSGGEAPVSGDVADGDVKAPVPSPSEDAPARGTTSPSTSTGDITPAQLRMLNAILSGLGVADEDRYAKVGALIGRTITSTKQLSKSEASKAIDALKKQETAAPSAEAKQSKPAAAKGESPFPRVITNTAKKYDLEGAELDAFVNLVCEWKEGGVAKLAGDPGAANRVMAVLPRWAEDYTLIFNEDGTPEFSHNGAES